MLYKFIKVLIWIYYTIFFRATVVGVENVPKKGAAILCSDHSSNYDPITMAAYINRLPRYMAKKELFQVPVIGWLITQLHAFPVNREAPADMKAFKSAIKVLKSEELLGIFAQGARVKAGDEKSAKAGVALIAMRGNAPVIPVAISGSHKPFSKIYISFGEPLTLDEYRGKKLNNEGLHEVADLIMGKINEMMVREA